MSTSLWRAPLGKSFVHSQVMMYRAGARTLGSSWSAEPGCGVRSQTPVNRFTETRMFGLTRHHERRLREVYRSAGWPCLDAIEIDLLTAGLIERVRRGDETEVVRVTEAGLAALATHLERNRRGFDDHEALVDAVVRLMVSDGRLVFRNLSLRGAVDGRWRTCRADLYSLRPSNVMAYTCPVIHEIKVRRADLLGDLAKPQKRAAYQALSAEFYYVFPEGLADVDEIPVDSGVILVGPRGLRPGRPSPKRAVHPGLGEWLSIARRGAEFEVASESQLPLRGPAEGQEIS
jgi:hypothetical protein